MKIVIIGSGNVATVLGRKSREAGHEILQVVGRNEGHAVALASILSCPYTIDWKKIRPGADLYLIALSDSVFPTLSRHLSLPGSLVVHTAGSVPLHALRDISARCGILYPLQSLRKEIRAIPAIPLLIDADRQDDLDLLDLFARTLSHQVMKADDATRSKLHLAGVIISNFSNHLYALAELFCRREGLDFDLLLPLIGETAGRLSYTRPKDAQTGPAIRGDEPTIQKHLALLNNYEPIKVLYELFTQQIRDFPKDL